MTDTHVSKEKGELKKKMTASIGSEAGMMANMGPIVNGQVRGNSMESVSRLDTLFQEQDAPIMDLMEMSRNRDQTTKQSLTDHILDITADVYYVSPEPEFTWENLLFTNVVTMQMHGIMRRTNVPATILDATPEAAPMRGIVWNYEKQQWQLTRYAIHVRVTDEELDDPRGQRIFLLRVDEIRKGTLRLHKYNDQYAIIASPRYITQALAKQGNNASETWEECRDRRWRYFGSLDKEKGIYDMHWEKQAEAAQAGLGEKFYGAAVICTSSMKKVAYNSYETEYSRSGPGAKGNLKKAAEDRQYIPGLQLFTYSPEFIETMDPEKIDVFARVVNVGCWVAIDAGEQSIQMWNGSCNATTELFAADAVRYLTEFDEDTGLICDEFRDFASGYEKAVAGANFAWKPSEIGGRQVYESMDPLIWIDEHRGAHVAETFGEIETQFSSRECSEVISAYFAKKVSREDKNALQKLQRWSSQLYECVGVPTGFLHLMIAYDHAARAAKLFNNWGGVKMPELEARGDGEVTLKHPTNDEYVVQVDGVTSFSDDVGNASFFKLPKNIPYGWSTVDALFEIANNGGEFGHWNNEFMESVSDGVKAMKSLEYTKEDVMGHTRLFDAGAFDAPGNLRIHEAKMFSSLSFAIETVPKLRMWFSEVAAGRVPFVGGDDNDVRRDEILAGIVGGARVTAPQEAAGTALAEIVYSKRVTDAWRKNYLDNTAEWEAAWAGRYGELYAAFEGEDSDPTGGRVQTENEFPGLDASSFAYFLLAEVVYSGRTQAAKENIARYVFDKGMTHFERATEGLTPPMSKITRFSINQQAGITGAAAPADVMDVVADEDEEYVMSNAVKSIVSISKDKYASVMNKNFLPSDYRNPGQAMAPLGGGGDFSDEQEAHAQAQFGLPHGEDADMMDEEEADEAMGTIDTIFSWLFASRHPLIHTNDESAHYKTHLIPKLRMATRIGDVAERYAYVQFLFAEVTAHNVQAMIKKGFPNPLGNIFIALPFVKLKMRAALWFRPDSETGKALSSPPHFYPSLDPQAQDWSIIFTEWSASVVSKPQNINLQEDASHGRYLSGHDHEFITYKKMLAHREDEDVSRGSLLAINTGCNFGRSQLTNLSEISLTGSHRYVYRSCQFRGGAQRKMRPAHVPQFFGAIWLVYRFGLKEHMTNHMELSPDASYATMKETVSEDLLVTRQRHKTKSQGSQIYDVVYHSDAPMPDIDGDLLKIFNQLMELSPAIKS